MDCRRAARRSSTDGLSRMRARARGARAPRERAGDARVLSAAAMRIVIDLQAAASLRAGERGIGRHSSRTTARAIAAAPARHEIWLALNAAFPATIAPLRDAFCRCLSARSASPSSRHADAGGGAGHASTAWRNRVGEPIRETFLHRPASRRRSCGKPVRRARGRRRRVGGNDRHRRTRRPRRFYDLHPADDAAKACRHAASVGWYQRQARVARGASDAPARAVANMRAAEAMALASDAPATASRSFRAPQARSDPPALEHRRRSALYARHGITRPFVMHAARIRRGVRTSRVSIVAYARLPAALFARTHQLVLVGVDRRGRARSHSRALPAREGLSARTCRSRPSVRRGPLAALLRALRIVRAFHRCRKGFGLPALEAMACGAPVIGATRRASRTSVADRRDALFGPRGRGRDRARGCTRR